MSRDTNNTTHNERIWSERERQWGIKVAPEKGYLRTDRIPTGKGRVS